MRSSNEIRIWLRTRFWYKKYLHNILDCWDYDIADSYLKGFEGVNTISAAFPYSETPEGIKYWGKREERFLRWYYHQKKEIFRCKWFTIQIGL